MSQRMSSYLRPGCCWNTAIRAPCKTQWTGDSFTLISMVMLTAAPSPTCVLSGMHSRFHMLSVLKLLCCACCSTVEMFMFTAKSSPTGALSGKQHCFYKHCAFYRSRVRYCTHHSCHVYGCIKPSMHAIMSAILISAVVPEISNRTVMSMVVVSTTYVLSSEQHCLQSCCPQHHCRQQSCSYQSPSLPCVTAGQLPVNSCSAGVSAQPTPSARRRDRRQYHASVTAQPISAGHKRLLCKCRATAHELAAALAYLHSQDPLHSDMTGCNNLNARLEREDRGCTPNLSA